MRLPPNMRIPRLLILILLAGVTACTTRSGRQLHDRPISGQSYVTGGHPQQQGDLYLPRAEAPTSAVLVIHGDAWVSGEAQDTGKFARIFAGAGSKAYGTSRASLGHLAVWPPG